MSLGALEATVVGTAMPTVIATLGGLKHYSWVFSAYLLTSTASVPIWGRLSDLYGRRRMYLTGIAIFLVGSMMSGAATSMTTLIVARAIQGLGTGAIIPLSMTIVGELYTLAERARTQAIFSGVWGVASVAGPLVGGYITDALSWRWVFYLNLPFGLLAVAVILLAYPPTHRTHAVRVDWLGAALLFAGISALLIALGADTGGGIAAGFAVAAVVLLGAFVAVERRVAEPILPLDLLKTPLIARTIIVVFLVGMALFGAIAFIPLFVQGVMGATATQAGPGADAALHGLGDHVDRERAADGEAGLSAAGDHRQRADDARIHRADDGRRRFAAQQRARVGPADRLGHGALDAVAAAGRPARRRSRAPRASRPRSTSSRAASARRSALPRWAR